MSIHPHHNLVAQVRKEEADLKLAEQAFDNFLQENDRKAMEAQKKVSLGTFLDHFIFYILGGARGKDIYTM